MWRAAAPEVRTLVALMRRLQNLKDWLVQETNRLSEPGVLKAVQRSLRKGVRFLKGEITCLEHAIDEHVRDHPRLSQDRDLLTSIPGVSDTTAHRIASRRRFWPSCRTWSSSRPRSRLPRTQGWRRGSTAPGPACGR